MSIQKMIALNWHSLSNDRHVEERTLVIGIKNKDNTAL